MDISRITNPLRLAKGSHQEGSGKGCAMNVVSYTNGDVTITDYPSCSAWPLAKLVQCANDALADDDGFLSPENSVIALELGWATVGTADVPQTVVYAWLAEMLDSPEWGILKFSSDRTVGTHVAGLLRLASIGGSVSPQEWQDARSAAYAADGSIHVMYAVAYTTDAYATRAADAYTADAYATRAADAYTADVYATRAAGHAAASCAAASADAVAGLVEFTRSAIAAWRRLAGLDEVAVDYAEVNTALEKVSQ